MIRHLAPLAVLLLAGCPSHPVATFTAADAVNASRMAKADTLDPQAATRAQCYDAWGNIATGVQSVAPGTAGIFVGVETGFEVQSTLNLPPCQAIAGQVMLWALRRAPIAGGLIP